MAFGFGDMIPYNQLPGAVAGQEAVQAVGAVNQGAMNSAKTRQAGDEADAADINDQLLRAKAPSALTLSNLKDAQSINHMPIKAGYDDLEAAHAKVMGESQEKPSPLEQKKIMALADEMAQAKAPKFDANNPADWLAKQDPTSNAEMTLVKAQAILDGRQNIANGNLDLRERKFQYQQDEDPVKEAGKDRRAGMMNPGAPGGTPPLKVQGAARGSDKDFSKTDAGRALNSSYGRKSLSLPNNGPLRQQIVNHYHDLVQIGDVQKAQDFFDTNKEFLPNEQAPTKVVKNKTPGSRGPNDDAVSEEVVPSANGLTQKPTITPLEDGQQPPPGTKQVVTVGHKVYGVGDQVYIKRILYQVTEGNGKNGGLLKVK